MSSDPVILSLETATLGGSVFLGRGTAKLAERLGDPKVSHSNSLLTDIAAALEEAGLVLVNVDGLACASGPGSFTGLRIGIATLKALAATLHVPCVGIPTLEAVAHSAGPSPATIALLPAGRGEVFSQMFSVSAGGAVTPLDQPRHISPTRLLEKYGEHKKITWAGPGAHAQRALLAEYAEAHGLMFGDGERNIDDSDSVWTLAPEVANLARNVAALSLVRFETGLVQTPQGLSAIYVRPSDAELNQPCL